MFHMWKAYVWRFVLWGFFVVVFNSNLVATKQSAFLFERLSVNQPFCVLEMLTGERNRQQSRLTSAREEKSAQPRTCTRSVKPTMDFPEHLKLLRQPGSLEGDGSGGEEGNGS